ncbi:P-loop containing nucleoside triphosphate hydrolase protein [Bisporella sp. PMI_857]|nr:P-loop containing nucleoside triphosphate hydrolase protein [Bisporella sp. PMI_857]
MDIDLPPDLTTIISASAAKNQRLVVLTCGIAGSGKSTLAKKIVSAYENFVRLSIDVYVYQRHGLYGRDYAASEQGALQDEAERALKGEFRALMEEGRRDVVLDFSFWSREYRDEWREMVRNGTRIVVVYFDAEEEVLWRRIEERREKGRVKGRDADSAAEITRELLRSYSKGFERPYMDEGQIITVKVE